MTGLWVDTTDLRAKAHAIRALNFTSIVDKPPLTAPDRMPSAAVAVENLRINADFLYRYQEYGESVGIRLAETLDAVALAYDQVDAQARASIEGTVGTTEPIVPQANRLDPPILRASLGPLSGPATDRFLVDNAQARLSNTDNGNSLNKARDYWMTTGNELHTASETFTSKITGWEGEAAQQAYDTLNRFGEWLHQLGSAWHMLAGEAQVIVDKHIDTLFHHTPVFQRYEQYEKEKDLAVAYGEDDRVAELAAKMAQCQQESDGLQNVYSSAVLPETITAPEPPDSTAPSAPVTGNGTRPAGQPGDGGGNGPGTGNPGGGGGGGPAGTTPATDPTTAPTSPMSAESPQGEQSGESGGGSQGGGSGSGGGSESGGGSGGGMPELPTGAPAGDDTGFPDYSTLEPVAASTGAGGGGSGGGGAGPMPLQPSVGGVAVGPSPSASAGTGGAAPVAAAAGGGMMGGMGGMAPMAGGAGAQAGKDKQRNPGVAPDEELYSEDRPWTEGIIGRPERRAGQGKKDAT